MFTPFPEACRGAKPAYPFRSHGFHTVDLRDTAFQIAATATERIRSTHEPAARSKVSVASGAMPTVPRQTQPWHVAGVSADERREGACGSPGASPFKDYAATPTQ